MMVHLLPPPRFNLPPPPMLSSDLFDATLSVRLTCSSIGQQEHYRQIPKSRLIAISCITFLLVFLFLIFLLVVIQFCRRRRSFSNTSPSKPTSIHSNHIVINRSRSYETISSAHTGVYVESIDTSATTFSTDPSSIVCHHCLQERDYSTISPPPYYHTLDILPSQG